MILITNYNVSLLRKAIDLYFCHYFLLTNNNPENLTFWFRLPFQGEFVVTLKYCPYIFFALKFCLYYLLNCVFPLGMFFHFKNVNLYLQNVCIYHILIKYVSLYKENTQKLTSECT